MTRLYYDNPTLIEFDAHVREHLMLDDGQPAVVLDRTAFYPTGGGQPHDTGTLNDVRIVDVQSREDGSVLHVLETALHAETVRGRVDWDRRFHHMQHHTGQHILTQAFVQLAKAHTVGFHLGTESITIDLDVADMPDAMLAEVEDLVNRIIVEDRPVTASIIDPQEAEDIRMRRMPDRLLTGGLRVIEVADFDRTACGGTHVTRTGQIGLLKILKTERRGDTTRVEFRCGGAALNDYRHKHTLLTALALELTCAVEDVPAIVARLRDDLEAVHKALKAARADLVEVEAARMLAEAETFGAARLVIGVLPDHDGGDLRALASALTTHDDVIVLLASRTAVTAARGAGLSHDMRPALQAALDVLSGRGGGRPDFAQGGGIDAQPALCHKALAAARETL
ncbi:MAG: alanyl-tRNA editing protein [Chloroflexi bacterium]|nr:alanyl-tRNA editing protein [Chloroflexota bacterium]